MSTEADMVTLLKKRYTKLNANGLPRYIHATQPQLFKDGSLRFADFIAVDSQVDVIFNEEIRKYERFDPPVHGFEIKVSRSDWLREYKTQGEKSAPWRSYCNYWWIVVPNKDIVKPEELPAGWGLLVGTKRLITNTRPVRNGEAEKLPTELMLTIARYSQRNIK